MLMGKSAFSVARYNFLLDASLSSTNAIRFLNFDFDTTIVFSKY